MGAEDEKRINETSHVYNVETWPGGRGLHWYFDLNPNNPLTYKRIEDTIGKNNRVIFRVSAFTNGELEIRSPTLAEMEALLERASVDAPKSPLIPRLEKTVKRRRMHIKKQTQ